MRKLLIAVIALGLFVSPASAKEKNDEGLSKDFSIGEYKESGDHVDVLVNSVITSTHDEDKYIPLHIGVGVRQHPSPLLITRKTFVLSDDTGKSYAMASKNEIMNDYGKITQDVALMKRMPLVIANLYTGETPRALNFYPYIGPGPGTDGGELPPFSWFQTLIYFPMPQAGLDGILKLTMKCEGLDEPIVVTFKVPLKKRHKDKDK